MSGSRSYSVEADGSISNNEVGVLSDEKEKGYLVDINGNIDFPVLGQLHVEGLTRRQLTELIKKRLINEELLKDPMVTVNFLNFKFSVLGEVGHVGTFEVKGDRITLLEALAMAGDLTPDPVWTVSPSSANMGTSDESCSTTSAAKTSSRRLTITCNRMTLST